MGLVPRARARAHFCLVRSSATKTETELNGDWCVGHAGLGHCRQHLSSAAVIGHLSCPFLPSVCLCLDELTVSDFPCWVVRRSLSLLPLQGSSDCDGCHERVLVHTLSCYSHCCLYKVAVVGVGATSACSCALLSCSFISDRDRDRVKRCLVCGACWIRSQSTTLI